MINIVFFGTPLIALKSLEYLFNSENKKILLQSSPKETQFDSLRDLRNNLDLIILEKTGNILGK